MNFAIAMAGRGSRFFERGYKVPKWLIQAKGKTLLEWSVDSLPLELCSNLIFIVLAEHERDFQASSKIKALYAGRKLSFVFVERPTRGQAETVLLAKSLIDSETPLLIYNIDTKFQSASLKSSLLRPGVDGVLGAFKSSSDKFSFAALDNDGAFVTEVAEKVPISDNALTGLYHFSRGSDFVRVSEAAIRSNELVRGEFYVAPLYNALIREGKRLIVDLCDSFDILGTPDELDAFLAKDGQ